MFMEKVLVLLPVPQTGVEASFSCVITCEVVQFLITSALAQGREAVKVNWTNQRKLCFMYFEFF